MPLDRESEETGRKRILQVFRYLEALNQKRNPVKRLINEQPWTLWLNDLPEHASVRRGKLGAVAAAEVLDAPTSTPGPEAVGDDFILKVQRPKLTQPPHPPQGVADWLRTGWDNPFKEVETVESRNERDAHGETVIISFEDDPERPAKLAEWLKVRGQWAHNEQPAWEAHKVFNRVYEIYGQIEREGERLELILGDGLLTWRRPEGGIRHPVLLQKIQLDFDPAIPEFTFRETDHPVELYSALFRAMPDVDGTLMGRSREELEQGGIHPLDAEATSGFLRSFVQRLAVGGEFVGESGVTVETDHPRIVRNPVVFMRTRSLGFATALEGIIEDLKSDSDLPTSLLNVVGVETLQTDEQSEDGVSLNGGGNEDESILLSKPANPEQLQIAQRLEKYGCVLVQGPPGTGKTHTIANLIGHLLARGQSVLVTSHTTKALRVLRSKVESMLQSLCVSVLESDSESRQQLESSVSGIVERIASDFTQLEQQAERLAAQRMHLLRRLAEEREKLRRARSDEYRNVIVGGESYPPSEAARQVAAGKGKHDWIPSPVKLGETLPLSADELIELYGTNSSVTTEDEDELDATLPDPSLIIPPSEFSRLVDESAKLSEKDLRFRRDLWDPGLLHCELEDLLSRLTHAVEPLRQAHQERWKITAIAAGHRGGAERKTWENLIARIKAAVNEAAQAEEALLEQGPKLAANLPIEEQLRTFDEIIEHLEGGGELGWWALTRHQAWKRLMAESCVNTAAPSRVEHFVALRAAAHLTVTRRDLIGRWERQMSSHGAPPPDALGDRPEYACDQYCQPLEYYLNWHANTWAPLETELRNNGFRWQTLLQEVPPNLSPQGDLLRIGEAVLNRLPAIFGARFDLDRWQEIDETFTSLERQLSFTAGEEGGAQVVSDLREAVVDRDVPLYQRAYNRLNELHQRHGALRRRRELLRQMAASAPTWSAAVSNRIAPHNRADVPGDAPHAWLWRQFDDELEARARVSIDAIQREIDRLVNDLQRITTELIDYRAWASQGKRTRLPQRQALMGWLQINRRIGAGTGIRVPKLRAEARRLMEQCRSAVPVWIMPLARVVENFKPQAGIFDVVIIDEASQSDVMGLIALFMGKRVVIVGDDEQVSPDAVAERVGEVQHLIDEHLQGIPNANLYDGKMSIYDLAMQSFHGSICLREHFRCVPEIIQFSNHLSYEGKKIKPLRDASAVRQKPPVIAHHVQGTGSESKVNKTEAETVASLIMAAIEQPEYVDQTFGVVSLVGDYQAAEIDKLLRANISPTEYVRREIVCGNAAQFQGDERAVMFLSVVDGPQDGPLRLRQEATFKKRYNVAASRAKNQMWVVHSLQPDVDLKPGDLRRRLIEYAQDPQAIIRLIEQEGSKVESEFERQVLGRLVSAGYAVTSQWKVGYYRIDLVVTGEHQRLAVECDGDRWHPVEKLHEDMARQAILERLGWKFIRIRGSEFFRDPERAMQPVFERLRALRIEPDAMSRGGGEESATAPDELKERVIRRAEEIRRAWNGEDALPENLVQDITNPVEGRGISELRAEPTAPPPTVNSASATTPGVISTHSIAVGLPSDAGVTELPFSEFGEGSNGRRSIDEIPLAEIRAALHYFIPTVGRIDRDVLIRKSMQQLGFKSLGRKIRSRLNMTLGSEIRAGRLQTSNDEQWVWK